MSFVDSWSCLEVDFKPVCFRQSYSRMAKRHQEPVLVFRESELKPKFAVSVFTSSGVFQVQGAVN